MPLGYSFETEEDQDLNPLAPAKAAGPQATQNPLANMAGAASPGLTSMSPFESAFGPMNGLSTDLASSVPGGTAAGPSSTPPSPAQPGAPQTTPQPKTPNMLDPWAAFAGTPTPQPDAVQKPDVASKGPEVGASQPTQDKNAQLQTRFQDMRSQLASAADPQQKAILQDKLSRELFGHLSDEGHDVKWDGDQLVVDGRRYIVGGTGVSSAAAPGGTATGPTGAAGAFPGSGWDADKWAKAASGQSDSAKYIVGESIARVRDQIRAIPDEAGRKAFVQQHLQSLVPQLEQAGWTVHDIQGEKIRISGHGDPPHWADPVGDIEGNASVSWTTDLDQPPGGPTLPDGPLLFDDVMTPRVGGAANVDPRRMATPLSGPMTVPMPGDGSTPGGPAAGYTPGTIDDGDLSGLSLDDILNRIGRTPDPGALDTDYEAGSIEDDYDAGRISNDPLSLGRVGSYAQGSITNDPLDTYSFDGTFRGDVGDELGALGAGETDPETEDLVLSILQNPRSLDARTIDMLKARSKDELAEMARTEDDDLLAEGYRTGNQDSAYLDSERRAAKGRRDQALVGSNRAIDLEAAATNRADELAAAGVGNAFANSRSQRLLAERGQRFTEAATGEDLEQDEVASKNRASQFDREGQLINEELRGTAYDRNADATRTNAGLTTQEAAFKREGELANEGLRDTAFKNRTGAQTTNEALRSEAADRNLKAAQANIDNQFRSAEERRAAVALASDTALNAAAQKGDRRALEEGFRAKAQELRQSEEKIRLDYLLATLSDATTRRGQDMSTETSRFIAELGAAVDRQKLAQSGAEFQMDLLFRLKQLAQQDAQFGASYGLDHARTAAAIDRDQWDRFASTFGD